jgi:GNAT superfamily N-acetyltransferase
MVSIEPEDAGSPDARWCLGHYYAELDERFEEGFEAPREPAADILVCLVARVQGQPAGCAILRALDPRAGEIVRMWVDRPHRGLGIAGRMLAALEDEARTRGFERVRLDTNRSLDEAKAMYAAAGYVEIGRYNDNPYANHWFEKRLT